MANKNRNMIIAYFPSAYAADTAAQSLKAWDKATDAVKLGGIGILTWQDGEIKTHKVGARAAGTGAKWGTILGATLGVLSGGVTLIGGALVGASAGALGGALVHKRLGLSDADKARLEDHIKGGGAVVVVMADDLEVEPTKAELNSLGGTVENYQVPDEAMEQLETAPEEPAAE
jgi:uncharacterized membrane protein